MVGLGYETQQDDEEETPDYAYLFEYTNWSNSFFDDIYVEKYIDPNKKFLFNYFQLDDTILEFKGDSFKLPKSSTKIKNKSKIKMI